MQTVFSNHVFSVYRNVKTGYTQIENKTNRAIFSINDADWSDFLKAVKIADKHVIKHNGDGF